MVATIVSTSCSDLSDLISVTTRTDLHIGMHRYNRHCYSRTNWFDLAGNPLLVSELEHLNALESIEAVRAATFEEDPLEANFWEQYHVPSNWNVYLTDTARESGGLDINDLVYGPYWTNYCGLHFGLFTDCDPEETCDCEGYNCVRAQSTVGHAAAAATTATSLGIPLIFIVPPTPTPSEIDAYNLHW